MKRQMVTRTKHRTVVVIDETSSDRSFYLLKGLWHIKKSAQKRGMLSAVTPLRETSFCTVSNDNVLSTYQIENIY